MAVSTVLFDFGGTLDSDGLTWLERFFPLYRRLGFDISKEDFTKAYYESDDQLASRHHLSRMDLQETLRCQVSGVLEIIAPESLDMVDKIVQPFLYHSRDYFRKIRPVLERLQERHVLGIVSNFYGNLAHILNEESLGSFFSVVSDSGTLGFLKPAPEIFLNAMNVLGAGPADTWMVGDSISRDMKGAEVIGLSHAWLRGSHRRELSPCCTQAVVLDSFDEIESCLDYAQRI